MAEDMGHVLGGEPGVGPRGEEVRLGTSSTPERSNQDAGMMSTQETMLERVQFLIEGNYYLRKEMREMRGGKKQKQK